MNNRLRSGYTLFEFFLTIMILAIVTVVALPLILYALKQFRINAYKNSAYSALEAIKLHVASTNFNNFPEEGIEIGDLGVELKNNKFDSGLIKKIADDKFQLVKLKRNNYCASGTTENMKVTDEGCGALDETEPTGAYVYLKNATNNSITVIASGTDLESEIKYYDFSIDGSKYTDKVETNEYTFEGLTPGIHIIKARVYNEADLKATSEEKTFSTLDTSYIECNERNNKESFQYNRSYICTYPIGEGYIYQYKEDGDWIDITLNENSYTFDFDTNKNILTRVIKDGNIVASATINTNNINTTLNGSYPELLDGMIPVTYDESRQSWIRADERKIYFDYDNKIWANVVFVRRNKNTDDPNSKNREYYSSNISIGEVVHDEDIIAHYVWIPKYKYILFNVNSKIKDPQSITINFTQEILTSKTVGDFITHPAFLYNNSNGFWISKYQNSAALTSSCYSDINECNKSDISLYSKANMNKITNISISNAHLNALNMIKENNIYGLNEEAKPHVLTNLEWGAVAYLANSIYGKNDNIGPNDSTTGNITGVFGMAGNLSEMVMGNYNKDAGKNTEDNSGFKDLGSTEWPSIIDYYDGITSKNRILGDATGETDTWYDSYSKFVNGENPFFIRGGVMEGKSSIYNYTSFTGKNQENITFRTVLSK